MKRKEIARDFKEFGKELLWYFLIILTLPVTIPILWWASKQDEEEDSNEAK